MKIALFSPYLPKHTGGGEKYLFDCAKILQEEGFEVSIAISSQVKLTDVEIEEIKKKYENFLNYSLNGINFIISPLFTPASFLAKILWTAKFDVLYYQTDGSLFFSLAKKNILHIQVPLRLNKSSWLEKIKLANWGVKNTNSEFTKKHVEKFWQTKVDYVHQPYVNSQEFIKAAKKEKMILSVGRFFCQLHSKRQDVLVEFFRDLVTQEPELLADWKLVLLGKNEDLDYSNKIADSSKGLNIELVHSADRLELLKIYQKASLYWHSSGYGINEDEEPEKVEHFGISTLEAMAAQAVPIVINKGGQKEILGKDLEECAWNDKAACLAKTIELIKNETKREKLAKLAQTRSLFFSKERFKNILLEMIRTK
jgi:glycosyltransferase involved in cell wall biosynthesis